MTKLVTPAGTFRVHRHPNEKEFEEAVVEQAREIFGPRRIYLDCKHRIGRRGGKQSIPDGYVIDLSRKLQPHLFLVENEIASHDLFSHIGVQLLQFSVSFSAARRRVRQTLFEELTAHSEAMHTCERYIREAGLRSFDHFLDELVLDKPFRAIVIIDQATDDLQTVLKNFHFSVEVIEFVTYVNDKGDRIYRFAPFLEEVEESIDETAERHVDVSELDTVVVPAREDGFVETFLGENCWHAVRIHSSMIPQIKHIAVYRVAPTSAITHWAPVRSIDQWRETEKAILTFAQPAEEIGPIPLVRGGRVKALQNLRYTTSERLKNAKNLDEAF